MKPRYYIASRLENAPAVRELKITLDAWGWQHTYDWTTHGSVQQCASAVIRDVADAEMEGVSGADVVIVLLPGGRGTHVELGVALGNAARVLIASSDPGADFGVTGRTCAFYHASGAQAIDLAADPDALLEALYQIDQELA
jgi:hypothetical protein